MAHPDKYIVNLSETERERLKDISRNGQAPAKKILHARILLLADQTHIEGGWTDQRIGEALGLHPYSIARIRKRFVTQGEAPALNRLRPHNPSESCQSRWRSRSSISCHLLFSCA